MDNFDKKTLTTSRGMTYTYYASKQSSNSDNALPTLLLQHGWPDHAAMWSGIANRLLAAGVPNRILIPDMLGYDGTSKPTDPADYRWDRTTKDMTEILDAEGVQVCVSIGHDWGSSTAQRVYNFHPDRVVGLVMLNVAYQTPNPDPFDLETANAATTKALGYPCLAYWSLFAYPEGPQILTDNVDRVYSAMHAEGATAMRELFCTPGAIKSYLVDRSSIPERALRPYARDPQLRQTFLDRMRRDGFAAPQQYYVAKNGEWQTLADRLIARENYAVRVPALYVGASDDAVCRVEAQYAAKQAGLLPDLEEHAVEACHWSPYERPAELAEIIGAWLGRKGFTAAKA